MAGLWYRVGTASVTNGSKKVTGFGSQWKGTFYKPDKGHAFYGPDGKACEIDYVESDTVLYLVLAYAGATAASQAYSIDITRTGTIPAFSRELSEFTAYAQGQYDSWQQVLTGTGTVTLTAPDGQQVQVPSLASMQQSSDSLQALMALTPAANKLIYFTGVDTAATASFTDFARSFLDDVNAEAARTTLSTPFYSGTATTADLNTLKVVGFYDIGGSNLNWPWPGNGGSLIVSATGGYINQLVFKSGDASAILASRVYNPVAGEWRPWSGLYNRNNVVGLVSQSGGVPSSAIIEQGSNANGEYTKFTDGTLICWRLYQDSSHTTTVSGSFNVKEMSGIAKPVPFVGDNSTMAFPLWKTGNSSVARWCGGGAAGNATNTWDFLSYCAQPVTSVSVSFYLYAIGRWFQ